MNADLKRVRDASLDDVSSSPSSSKRRALDGVSASSFSSPPPGDDAADDGTEDWRRVVNIHQKEAIYRQMVEYRRSAAREKERSDRIEAQRKVLEASLHSVELCWAQLVVAIRDAAGIQDDKLDNHALKPSIAPVGQLARAEELDAALQSRLPATQQLVTLFFDLASKNGLRPVGNDELQSRCQQLQVEANAAQAQTSLLQTQLSQISESRDTTQRDLERAEKKLIRQRMEFDKERDEWRTLRDAAPTLSASSTMVAGASAGAGPTSGAAANGSGRSTPNGRGGASEEDVKPAQPDGTNPTSMLQNSAELEQLAESQLQQIRQLRSEQVELTQELDRLRLLISQPSEAALRESPFFQVYLHQLASQTNRADTYHTRFEASEKNLDTLKENNLAFRDAVMAEARSDVDSLRQQIGKKDADLVRLRGQRDEMNAELSERRARETDKMRHADEMEALATTQQERIVFFVSEVRRLRGLLGARDGAEGYLAFLKTAGVDGDYIKDLEAKVSANQDRIAALTAQIEAQSSDAVAAGSETAVRVELESARRALTKYERVLGENADAADDVKELAAKLEQAEKDKASLQLKLSEAEASTNALFAEVEGLSKQWEGLEHTLRTKVFELKDAELRMSRLSTEKAKADNKYFAAMRTKEALDAECKTAQRSVDKQLKMLERAQEVERHLTVEVAQHEKTITSLKNALLDVQSQAAKVASEYAQLELRLQASNNAANEAQGIMRTRVAEAVAEKEARAKLQDEAESAQRGLKKLKERNEAMVAASGSNMSASELATKEERDKLWKLLRCSCCEQNFKQQVITKCMHTFCKGCLDSRIASRQRKCPACGLAFAKEDIQTLYWQ